MRFRYDPESGAMYIRVREGEISETLEMGGGCYLDIAADGTVRGLECLSLDEFRELIERSGGELKLPDRVLVAEEVFERSERDPFSLEDITDPTNKRVLELHFLEGLSYQEIADILGVPLATVYTRLRAGLETLKESRWGKAETAPGRVALSESGRLLLAD